MVFIRSVLGDLDPARLGRTDSHEHFFQISPLLPGDELDDEVRSAAEARLLRQSGFGAVIDATPTALGRNPEGVARISASQDLHVVAATGAHRQEHYPAGHWLPELTEVQLAQRFVADLQIGLPVVDQPSLAKPALTSSGGPVRAGLVKAGIGYWRMSGFERRVLAAAAGAHAVTGAPIMVHLEHGSAALEVLGVLNAEGVAAERVVLAHVDRNPDPVLHAELAAAGAYLGYDGFARTRDWPDTLLLDTLLDAAELGAAERLLLGGDVARRTRYLSYGGMPGLGYLGERVVPRLVAASVELAELVLVANPARLLTINQEMPSLLEDVES
jgi:predicted metal-dependent phosphotriesterase family hydrolase